jgi:hypothetical protein
MVGKPRRSQPLAVIGLMSALKKQGDQRREIFLKNLRKK